LGGGVDGPVGRTTAGLARRTLQDRRDRGIAATIVRLVSSGEPVLVVCADATARAGHLEGRLGGFALCSHATLERSPELAQRFRHIVVLDPPACAEHDERARMGEPDQCTHLAWGTAELRFASDIHEREYGLRASLAALYRSLRDLGGVEGEGLETALRGDPSQSRSPALAGRLLRVLTELRLVDLDRERAAVVVLPGRRATLEHSVAYRAYQGRLEDGRRYLGSRTMEAA
jgi:single-stranded-DNA-specific exonuclease